MSAAAIKTDIDQAKGKPYGSIEFNGVEYAISRKPNALLLAELARTGSGDPDAYAVIAEFFAVTLGDNYPAFKKAVYASDEDDLNETLMGLISEVLEKTLGRPTE